MSSPPFHFQFFKVRNTPIADIKETALVLNLATPHPLHPKQEGGNDAIIKIVARVTPARVAENQETETLADAAEIPADEGEMPPIPDVTIEEEA